MTSSNSNESKINNNANSPGSNRSSLGSGHQISNENNRSNISSEHRENGLIISMSNESVSSSSDGDIWNGAGGNNNNGDINDINNNNNSQMMELENFETTIDDLYNNFSNIIVNQYDLLLKKKENIEALSSKLGKIKERENWYISKEKYWLKEKLKMNMFVKENDVIDINIGGTHEISTTRNTLIKYKNSGLGLWFLDSENLPKINGKVFWDRDGAPFINLIYYLRTGKFPFFNNEEEQAQFFIELNFWNIPFTYQENRPEVVMPNVDTLLTENIFNSFHFDPEWCAPSVKVDDSNCLKITKNTREHGIVFCKEQYSIYSTRLDIKVCIGTWSSNKSNWFIGWVDRSKYKHENLISKLWKDSPSSYFWDVWNMQLIKTDEKGNQVGKLKGYGCACQESETLWGIEYDYKSRNLIFYKNNMCWGIAFRNVENGWTPALDLLFEEGFIEIIKDKGDKYEWNMNNNNNNNYNI